MPSEESLPVVESQSVTPTQKPLLLKDDVSEIRPLSRTGLSSRNGASSRPVSRGLSPADLFDRSNVKTPNSLYSHNSSQPGSRALQRNFEGLDEENRVFRRARTPASRRQKLFVGSREEDVLARPLSTGMLYATQIASFDELAERNLWEVPEDQKVRLPQQAVQAIYRAKCIDQHCQESFDRARRFHELVNQQCAGQWFVLRQCGIGINALRAIVDTLVNDEHYTHLDLSGNTLNKEGGALIGELLRKNDTLVVLRLQSAQLGEGIADIAEALHENNTLTALDFSGICGIHRNTIWGSTAVAIGLMMQQNSVISTLNLSHCGLHKYTKTIARACAHHAALTNLNLAGNKMGIESCNAVGQLLAEGDSQLLTLNLDENGISCEGIEVISVALGGGERTAASLTNLILSSNNIGVKGCTALAAAIRDHPHLSKLVLDKNRLCRMGVDDEGYRLDDSNQGVAALFTAAGFTPQLETISIVGCEITSLPDTFSAAIKRSRSLKKVIIAENTIGDDGAVIIADALSSNSQIEAINFSFCGITTEGAKPIAHPLEAHAHLRHLRCHQVGWDPRAAGFIDAIRHNSSILSVDFRKEIMNEVAPSLKRNKGLMIQSAGPALADNEAALALEEKNFSHTQELIEDEKKRREKLTEAYKLTRDKQKVVISQYKGELQELQETLERQNHVYKTLDKQIQQKEEDFMVMQRNHDQARAKLQKKLDSSSAARADVVKQCDQLAPKVAKANETTEEEEDLKNQMILIRGDIRKDKRFCEQFEREQEAAMAASKRRKSRRKSSIGRKKSMSRRKSSVSGRRKSSVAK